MGVQIQNDEAVLEVWEKERKAFWKNPKHDAPNRRYRRRISNVD